MEMRSLGKTHIPITPIILGTWQAGKRLWVGIQDTEMIHAIKTAVEAGITTIDTAEEYGEGYSERIIAQAVADQRDRLVYATKVFANHLKYNQVIEACERSLKNLKTDYIDLYQIHWPSGSFKTEIVPIEETMNALNYLKEQGKIRAIGVSNFSCSQLEEAMQYGRIDSIQPAYSLFWRNVEVDLMPYCIEHQISILAYSSLAQGLLTGKFKSDHQFDPKDNRYANRLFQGETFKKAEQAVNQLRPIAERYQCTLAQLALAWLIAQPQTHAIAGVRNAQQALDNAKAAEIKLLSEDIELIDRIGQPVSNPFKNDTVMWTW
ncbi:aldo/keto reductase [Rippkaea orientalis PCC 8801]|uniref:Aldo/keto reductase n=1 Tax=Rippkaea orientalis (strain PCC 8801 / RF-1) TaxID=41431 RepID=B7JXC5_RIPO1|nr:aldo/keto reductase [Rippkaea orientalis]ACK67113.1 aldo/keto reductase [Rippkaea orientalis PCC 8801]